MMGGSSADVYRTKGSHTIMVSCVDKVKSKCIFDFCVFYFFIFRIDFTEHCQPQLSSTLLQVSMEEFHVQEIERFTRTLQTKLLAA